MPETESTPRTPVPGDADHTAILAAVRAAVQQVLHKPVAFEIDVLRTLGDHAYLQATMHEDDGQSLDYADTALADEAANGLRSNVCMALLRRQRGRWELEASRIGATDLAWAGWIDEHDVPEALFATP